MEKRMRYEIADYLNTAATGSTETYTLMGVGFNNIDESLNAQSDSKTYVNEKAASSTVTGYEPQFPFDSDLISDEAAVMYLYNVGRNQKVGADAQTNYVRVELFSPVTGKENTYKARKFVVSIEVTDCKGDGGQPLVVSGNLNQVGEFVDGTFDTTTKTFTAGE